MKKLMKQNLARLLAVVMITVMMVEGTPSQVHGETQDGDALMLTAARGLYEAYASGTPVGGYGNFGGYEAYVMKEAEIDVTLWEREGLGFEDELTLLINDSLAAGYEASQVKRFAADYLGALSLGFDDQAEALLDTIIEMQQANGAINTSPYGVYSDIATYDYLTRAGVTSSSGLNIELMAGFLENNQHVDGGLPGSWPDFMSTTQSLRAASTTASAIELVTKGKAWVVLQQKDHGGYAGSEYDDVVVDTSEAILLAERLGQDVTDWNGPSGKDPKDYMLEKAFTDGTFGQGNVTSLIAALDAYRALGYDLQSSQVLGLDLSLDKVLIGIGDKAQASVEAVEVGNRVDGAGLVEWSSTDSSVATVDAQGIITGVSPGSVYIKGTYDGLQSKKKITITEDEAVVAFYHLFMSGTPVDAGWGNISNDALAMLIDAGHDLSDWVYNGTTIIAMGQSLIESSVLDQTGLTAKRLAQDLYLAKVLGQTSDMASLLTALLERHGDHGKGGIDGSPYSDTPALELLLKAELLQTSGFDLEAISENLIGDQSDFGAWPSSWPDFMTTAQTLRVLDGIKANTATDNTLENEAIDKGLQWLRSTQQSDGSYLGSPYDDVVVDTAEAIFVATALGEDPSTWVSSEDKSPADFFENQSYESLSGLGSGNAVTHVWAFEAFRQLESLSQIGDEDGGNQSVKATEAKAYISIIDQEGKVIYGPKRLTMEEEDAYGLTALGILDATGLDWSFKNGSDDFVDEIDGEANEGSSGWMYSVNGRVPMVPAINKTINPGDQVIWWYSTSSAAGSPDWPEEATTSAASTELDEAAMTEVEKVIGGHQAALKNHRSGVLVMGIEDPMLPEAVASLDKVLKANKVNLLQKFEGKAVTIADEEVVLMLPAAAHKKSLDITVSEMADLPKTGQYGVRIQGGVYEFGPSGTQFDQPVTISIKVAISENQDISRLTPAWFDAEAGVWVPLTGIIDYKTGMVTFQTDHFSRYAVIEKQVRKSFADMDSSLDWAKDAVEILAGEGIIAGTGNGFEPKRSITRGEFVKVMTMALGYNLEEASGHVFTDVDTDNYFAPYIESSKREGLIMGDPQGTFRPSDSLMRSEIAAMIGRLKDEDASMIESLDFKDQADIHSWAVEGVKFAVANGIIEGDDHQMFNGGDDLTRAEAAVIIYRYLTYLETK